MKAQGNDFIPNMLIRSSESEPTIEVESNVGVGETCKDVWLEAPTNLLLSLVEDLRPKVGKTFDLKNTSKMWQKIQKTLFEEGYTFTVAQVQGIYQSLERRYKSTKIKNKRTARNRESCPYQSELDKVLSEKRGIHPEYILDNIAQDGLTREDLLANESFSEPNTSSISETRADQQLNERGSANPFKRECCGESTKLRKNVLDTTLKWSNSWITKWKCDNERNELLKAILQKF